MPTDPNKPEKRDIVTGSFDEVLGYAVDRPTGSHDWLLIYTLGGAGRIHANHGAWSLGVGEVLLLQPDRAHRYDVDPAVGRWSLLWAHFMPRPAWFEWLRWPELDDGVMRLALGIGSHRDHVALALREAHHAATGYQLRRQAMAMNALERAILWCDEANPQALQETLDPRVRSVLDHLCRHMDQNINIASLADIAKLSESRLAHLFREQVGRTPMQFLEQQRLSRARQLLELTALPIGEVANRVGYDNPFYFTQRFKKSTGLSPRAYRNQMLDS